MNIDWSKAPEWANAVVEAPCGNQYYVEAWGVNSKRQRVGTLYADDVGADMTIKGHSWSLVAERPSDWNGEGLPPVGKVCRLRVRRTVPGGWGDAEIMYSSATAVVWRWIGRKEEYASEWYGVEYEPIRTPEQIAAEEREQSINAMIDIVCSTPVITIAQARIVAGRLYDANWRKQVTP